MKDDSFTDITFELFNYCNGSCPGCMLSSFERKTMQLSQSLQDIENALKEISLYGVQNKIKYRVVFSFGDTFKLNSQELFALFDICKENDLAFGTTVTCVDEDFSQSYENIAIQIKEKYKNTVLDITIDPFRLNHEKTKNQYTLNLQNVMKHAQHLHLQVLASEALFKSFSPEKLLSILEQVTKEHSFFLSFSPTLSNLEEKKFHYDLNSAHDYMKKFYSLSKQQNELYQNELERFKNKGSFSDFSKLVFHVDHQLNVYPVNYSIYGDIIRDDRNKLKSFGNLKVSSLDKMILKKQLIKLDIQNNLLMDSETFGCSDCQWFESCTYSGIGLIRGLYKDYEFRTGHCYGPGFSK